VFLAELRSLAPQRDGGAAAAPDLDARLAAACARGRAAFPGLAVPDETFARHLAVIEARADAGEPAFDARAVEDLYLACACVARVAGAAEAFDERCVPAIRAGAARLAGSAAARDEVVQAVRDAVLVGRPDAPPKIAGYTGKGPLARWASVTGQRLALTALRSAEIDARARGALAAEAPPPADPEMAFLKERYRGELEQALAALLESLGDRERALLRLSVVQGMSAESIGKIYGVSRSTAQRWVEEVRGVVADEVRRLMRDRVGLSASGVGDVARLVASQVDLSLSRLLRTS
jgi:RNA polymerase sigma-70 factor (ECF subfamily)